MCVDSERHTHLTYRKAEAVERFQSGVSIKHLYLSLVAKVYLCLVFNSLSHIARYAQPGVTHFKAPLTLFRLVFILSSHRTMYFRCEIHFFILSAVALCGCIHCNRAKGCKGNESANLLYHKSVII